MLATTRMEMIVKCALETQSNLYQVMLLTVILTQLVMELLKSLMFITLTVVSGQCPFHNWIQQSFKLLNFMNIYCSPKFILGNLE